MGKYIINSNARRTSYKIIEVEANGKVKFESITLVLVGRCSMKYDSSTSLNSLLPATRHWSSERTTREIATDGH